MTVAETSSGVRPERLLALAAGTVRELDPPCTIAAAAEAGWPGVGVAVDPESWSAATAREARRRADDTGVVVLDVEAVFVTPTGDHGHQLVEAAGALGARHVLVVGLGVEQPAFTGRFAELCDLAAPLGVSCVVEFMPFLAIPDLVTALAVVHAAARPNAGVLVDALHLARSGATPADLAAVDPALLPYVQICDAPAVGGDDHLEEALEGRCLPGEGELPLAELLDVLDARAPRAALSAEVLSRRLREDLPDPTERARAVLAATRLALRGRRP